MKQIKPNTPLNVTLNYQMQTQTNSGYKLRSNNYNNMQITQINQKIKAILTITQIQKIIKHKLNKQTKSIATYPTDQNNNKATLIYSIKHRITCKHSNQTTIADL